MLTEWIDRAAGPLRARLDDAASRLRHAAQLGISSGLVWDLHGPGVVTAAKQLLRGRAGPSTIYRIHAANTPERTALSHRGRTYTFAQIDRGADRVAGALRARGFAGKSILVAMKNRAEYMLLSVGASRVGAAVVTVSWRSTAAELAFLARNSGAVAIVFDEAIAATVESAVATLREGGQQLDRRSLFCLAEGAVPPWSARFDDLFAEPAAKPAEDAAEEGAVVVYTSGTTGRPKGAVRKFNAELLPMVVRFLGQTPMRHDDVHLAACPLYHTTAFGFIAFTHILGGQVVLLDEFDPHRFLQAIERHRVTTTVLVPTMLHRLLALGDEEIRRYDTRSLRALFCTSAPLPGPDSDHAMDLFGDIVFNLYGSTETGVVTLAYPEDLRRSPGTIGRAAEGNEIRLLDDDGREVADGEVGELFAKNAMLVAGYHQDEAATNGSMREGFFSVGDTAYRDARGCYHLAGRKRDMIISGGVNVYPAEVEATLEAHAEVDEVAVIGVPDREWGERVTAVVVLRRDAARESATAALKAWCKERLAGPKVPREIILLPAGEGLPRNPTGKVQKRELRARFGAG
jgi:fatty-acyl-CoA synthase